MPRGASPALATGARAREQAGGFFASFHADHALMRRDELNQLSQVSSAEQVDASEFARRLLTSRYEVRLSAFSCSRSIV